MAGVGRTIGPDVPPDCECMVIIVRDVRPYIALADGPILDALAKISGNKAGIVFCTDHAGRMVGVLTDGDFRRWVVGQSDIDLHQPVANIANTAFTSSPVDADRSQLAALFSTRVTHIPLLDGRGHVVALATAGRDSLRLGKLAVDDLSPTVVIAEIGNNHNGDLGRAFELIDLAAESGADCAKFQMRDMSTLYRNEGRALDVGEDLGTQYTLDLLSRFNLPTEDLLACLDRCQEQGLVPLCTPWDRVSVRALDDYGIPGFKIASADLTNHDLLHAVAVTGRPVLLSTGMSSEAEIIEAVDVLRRDGAAFVLLHCNSTYPAPFKDVNLRYLERLREIAGGPVGYSGHERGASVALAAVALGAKVIEKHFTVDRGLEGNDHKVSLLPHEFRAMVDGIRQVEESLGTERRREVTQGEMMNRVTLAKSLVAARPIEAGSLLTPESVAVKSPGRGLQPNRRHQLIGRRARRAMAPGDFFYPSDLEDDVVEPRPYAFRRPWGLPVRFHDLRSLVPLSNPDLVEFHLSYQDLDVDPEPYLDGPLDLDLVVHSPELFRGDHLLDLASPDDDYRARSVAELQRVVELTRRLAPWFTRATRPLIIVNMGGFTSDRPVAAPERDVMYERVLDSLALVDEDGVEVIAQTMPPFPWLFGGQMFHNLFLDGPDTARFAEVSGHRICLDTSHSRLATNHRSASFHEYVEQVAPHTAHLHVVDAEGTDGEGLQIGDGSIDFAVLAGQLDRLCPDASFIPEIWQGHKNDGEGFWTALDRLEQWF